MRLGYALHVGAIREFGCHVRPPVCREALDSVRTEAYNGPDAVRSSVKGFLRVSRETLRSAKPRGLVFFIPLWAASVLHSSPPVVKVFCQSLPKGKP